MNIMFGLIVTCFIVYFSAYFCLNVSGQSLEVTPIQSYDDYFINK
nr:hypothetical protein [Neobacillus sp. Marseille-Q6967]